MKQVLLRINILLSCILLLQAFPTFGQLSVTGEVRPRAEYRHGFKTLMTEDADPAFFVEQRSRIYLKYGHERFNLGITLQDVRVWGNTSQIYKDDPSLTNLSEAWGEFLFNENFSIKFGRQVLAYDNDRILGSLDWAQQGRSHDLALLKYADSTLQIHVGAAFNQDSSTPEYAKLTSTYYSGVNNYKTMQFAWLHKDFQSGNFSLLFLNNGVQAGPDTASTVNFSQTLGGIVQKKAGKIKLQGEFYQQLGKNGGGKDLNAQLIAANASLPLGAVNLTVGGDYLSGTPHDEGSDRSFNPLYGTNHKFYGFMDYFYVGNSHVQNSKTTGLLDVYVSPVFKLSPNATLVTAVHQFFSPVDVYTDRSLGFTGNKQKNLGTEIDLVLNLKIVEQANLNIGYSHLFATDAMRAIKNGSEENVNNWAWVMLTLKPKIL